METPEIIEELVTGKVLDVSEQGIVIEHSGGHDSGKMDILEARFFEGRDDVEPKSEKAFVATFIVEQKTRN